MVRKRCSLELTFKCLHVNVAYTARLAAILDESQLLTLPCADSWTNKLEFQWVSMIVPRRLGHKLQAHSFTGPIAVSILLMRIRVCFQQKGAHFSLHFSREGIHDTSRRMKQQRKETNDPTLHLMMNCSIVKGCGS